MKFNCGCTIDRLDWEKINLDCPAVWDMIGQGLTKGVFQLEESLGRNWCKKIKPRNIDELADVISLIRPGCLEAPFREDENGKFLSITETYRQIKEDRLQPEYIHEVLEDTLKNTFGVPIYQEQIMEICRNFAGFSLQEADDARKAMGKKLPEKMKKVEEKFIAGAKSLGRDEGVAKMIFSWIDKFSGYGFNKCVSGKTKLVRPSKNQYGGNDVEIGHLYKLVNDRNYAVKCKQLPLRKKLRSFGYGKCLALDNDGRIRPRNIKTIHYNGSKEIYRVTDNYGRTIECTLNHKFMTENHKMVPVGEIGVGGRIICHRNKYDDAKIYDYSMHISKNRESKAHLVDKIGRHNGRFIDGNWSAYKTVTTDNEDIINCELCGTTPNRLEWHHIDGDRSNNIRENLLKLCVSCHKKEDYKIGRTKRWEKGHASEVSTIVSIDYVGVEDTYDVEMDTDEHNWIANGFVVSNSHAVGYAMVGYRTAYAKVHFPLEFFKAKLTFSENKQDEQAEVKLLVNEAKLFGVEVGLPDLRVGNLDFEFHGDRLLFGLTHIKNVGQSSIEDLKGLADLNSEAELFIAIFSGANKIKKNVMEALIKSGALDYCIRDRIRTLGRFRMLGALTPREVSWLIENPEIFDKNANDWLAALVNAKIPRPLEKRVGRITEAWDVIRKELGGNRKRLSIAYEKFHLGMAISGSETELYHNHKIDTTCRDFLRLRNGTRITLGVLIEEIRNTTDKRGQPMCFMKVSDSTYMLDGVVVFSSIYAKCAWILEEGKVVLISGKKQDASLLVDTIDHI